MIFASKWGPASHQKDQEQTAIKSTHEPDRHSTNQPHSHLLNKPMHQINKWTFFSIDRLR